MNPTALTITILYSAVCVIGIGIILAVWRSTHARSDGEPRQALPTEQWAEREKGWFALVAAALVILLFATIFFTPYDEVNAAGDDAQIVQVDSLQFAFLMEPSQLKAGVPVEFHVRAQDVNHGFAVYNEDDVLLFQISAMPDHVNRRTYTFKKPGTYQVLCFEFCGVNHHNMITEFEVVS